MASPARACAVMASNCAPWRRAGLASAHQTDGRLLQSAVLSVSCALSIRRKSELGSAWEPVEAQCNALSWARWAARGPDRPGQVGGRGGETALGGFSTSTSSFASVSRNCLSPEQRVARSCVRWSLLTLGSPYASQFSRRVICDQGCVLDVSVNSRQRDS